MPEDACGGAWALPPWGMFCKASLGRTQSLQASQERHRASNADALTHGVPQHRWPGLTSHSPGCCVNVAWEPASMAPCLAAQRGCSSELCAWMAKTREEGGYPWTDDSPRNNSQHLALGGTPPTPGKKHRTPDPDEISVTTGDPGPNVTSGIEMQSYISCRYPERK